MTADSPDSGEEAENHSDDPFIYLSDIFKHISHYRRRGHQIGRKVGDMLEVLTLAAIYNDLELRRRLILEPRLEGFSGAKHKVEFAIYELNKKGVPTETIPTLLSFIECKKVGVEQTINSGFKKTYPTAREAKELRVVPYEQEVAINFNPRWMKAPTRFSVIFKRKRNGGLVEVKAGGKVLEDSPLENNSRLIFGLTKSGIPFFCRNSESLRDVHESIRLCKILEISEPTQNGVVAVLNDCLAGPQTPEKAKQASFVALDIRRGRFGQFDKRPNEKECVSVLVMTEFSHWEQKSQNMVKSSLDHNLVVDDSLVIEAIDGYEKAYGVDFLDRMTKEFFMSTNEARVIANDIIKRNDGKIFRDIEDGQYKRITYVNGAVVVTAK